MSSIFDIDTLSEENDKLGILSLQGLDKENALEYILSYNGLQLNKQYKIKHILEYNNENGGILYSNNKYLYHTLISIIGKYTNNADYAKNYNYIEKEIINYQLPDLNNDKLKNYIIPLEKLLDDKTFPENTFVNSLKIRNIYNYIAYFLYNAAICIILNVENNITNTYIFYTGLPLIYHNVSKNKVDIKQFIKSVNVNLKLMSYTKYDSKHKLPYYQRSILIPYSSEKSN